MAQGCLKCLKITMCAANFLCFICGVVVLGFGIYLLMNFKIAALTPSLDRFNIASMLMVTGIIITGVSFLGFMGALKENRCLLLTFFLLMFVLLLLELTVACLLLLHDREIGDKVREDLMDGLQRARDQTNNSTGVLSEWDLLQEKVDCCGVYNWTDWGAKPPDSCCLGACGGPKPLYREKGCFTALKNLFEENFLSTGICVIVVCIVEVLAMCFAMTLFCHIRTGLGYKL